MVADTVLVDTRRLYAAHKSSDPLSVTIEGQESIFWIQSGQRETPGTTTKLILRKSKNPWEQMTEEKFIKSVETVIPNPPFKITIKTSSHQKVRDESSFALVTASSLKDYSWDHNDNIRNFEIDVNNKEFGIIGSAIVAVLETGGMPTYQTNINSKHVQIEENIYSLHKKLILSENKIVQESSSISINDDCEIIEDTSTQHFATSKSRLSLHGIEIPTTLFPDYWRMKTSHVKISWPFPLILVLDVCGNGDLDLNSSRTDIIMSEKWLNFEEQLAYTICNELARKVKTKYWQNLKSMLIKHTKNEVFISAIKKVVKS
ncbi:hypothetical protein [Geomonas terrae]|uniref:hypothetical protein n=1 Tax=Geomonas terrae TaxID=2562681 RepID=UPI0018E06D2E|nr:hypothetical protein [Geomonas terrae]